MRGVLTVATAPIEEPVTLEEAKLHLRVDHDLDDVLIGGLITAAREWVEAVGAWCTLVTTGYAYTVDAWPSDGVMRLPRPPLQDVTSIVYTDADGIEHTVAVDDYVVNAATGRVMLTARPSETLAAVGGIVVNFVAGYGGAEAVPEAVKAAIKLLIGDWYENREATLVAQGVSVVALPRGVEALLATMSKRGFDG